MIHAEHIDVGYLQDHPLDDRCLDFRLPVEPVIFGVGGNKEAALRSAYYL